MVRTMGLNLRQRSKTWPCFAAQQITSTLVSEYNAEVDYCLPIVGVLSRSMVFSRRQGEGC